MHQDSFKSQFHPLVWTTECNRHVCIWPSIKIPWVLPLIRLRQTLWYLLQVALNHSVDLKQDNETSWYRWEKKFFVYLQIYPGLKGWLPWPKVSSLVFQSWSLSWTNGSNTQLKWKLRYSPIQCAYLEPSVTYFSHRQSNRIPVEIANEHSF